MKVEVDFQPIGKHVEVDPGTTILEAAQEAGVGISAICGGAGSCDACRVRLDDQEQVGKPNETEKGALDDGDLAAGMRLACQTEIFGPSPGGCAARVHDGNPTHPGGRGGDRF